MEDFFGRLKEGVAKGVTTVGVRSREALDAAKIKSQIAALQAQRRNALEELGNVVYVMFSQADYDQIRINEKCSAVSTLDVQIKAKESELSKIHSEADQALGSPSAVGMCTCGEEFYEGAKFCGKCGRSL